MTTKTIFTGIASNTKIQIKAQEYSSAFFFFGLPWGRNVNSKSISLTVLATQFSFRSWHNPLKYPKIHSCQLIYVPDLFTRFLHIQSKYQDFQTKDACFFT
jgi:hypothetical protein